MTIPRLIQQLLHAQQKHGDLSAIIVHAPAESESCDPPLPRTEPIYFGSHGDQACHIWAESNASGSLEEFSRLCPALCELALPEGLRAWQLPPDNANGLLRWLWILGGFATAKHPGRTPRAHRVCWGSNGHTFHADRLESLRKSLPKDIVKAMPPDADCWMIRLDNIIQLSIELLDGLPGEPEAKPPAESAPAGPTQLHAPTRKGAQSLRLVAFLTKHHEYEAGHADNYTPAESRDIASGAKVRPSTVSDFLKREFPCTDSPRDGYIAACRNQAKLLLWLMVKHGDQLPERTESLDDFDPDSIDRKW